MKITKESTIKGEFQFSCDNCGAKFLANQGEYKIKQYDKQTGSRDVKTGFITWDTMLEYTPIWELSCTCPVCGYEVELEIPTGKPKYEKKHYSPYF